jgi:WS/DGAT/MGAT family acyltransferase
MPLERLTYEDARILALESARVAGHTCKVLVLEPPGIDLARLRAHVGGRLGAAPRLRQRLAPTPWRLAAPAWVDDPSFDLARHVQRVAAEPPVRLDEVVGRLMAERLDRAHPLWALHLVEGLDDGGCALVWKLHHCMCDGAASLRFGAAVLWDAEPDAAPPPRDGWTPAPAPGTVRLLAAGARDRAAALAGGALGAARTAVSPAAWAAGVTEAARLPGTVARELRRDRIDSPLDLPIDTRRAVAFISLRLDDVKRIGHAQPGHVTVNDVVLSLVAGGLRRWMEGHGASPDHLRVQVPVSLHGRDAHPDALANRDSWICLGLPLATPDPVARLQAINAATAERKRDHDAETLDEFFGVLRHAAPPLARFAARLTSGPRTFALSVSNVPGPAEDRWIAGVRIRRMTSLAEIGEHHALRVSAVSYAGTLAFGLCADPAPVSDLDAIARGIDAEAADLLTTV